MGQFHTPALLQEALANLAIIPNGLYVDATIGGAGHTLPILNAGGKVLALDQDPEAISYCQSLEALQPALASRQLILINSNFSQITEVVKNNAWQPLSGILLDLGVSSHQLDSPQRGFSFQKDAQLDMRMNTNQDLTAYELVNTLPVDQLASILKKFGDVIPSFAIAQQIVSHRPIKTTFQLASITSKWTRTAFQAFRIAVNDELGSLELVLSQAIELLSSGGKLVIITFHSLEDRLVKSVYQLWNIQGLGYEPQPKGITPSIQEVQINPRAKSAKLRVYIKH